MMPLAALAVSLATPSDHSELVWLRQRVAELEGKSAAFKLGCPTDVVHGVEQHARALEGPATFVHKSPQPQAAPTADEHGAPADEHGEHGGHSHTIFKMPDNFNKDFMLLMLVVLVIVTISFEKGSEALEEAVGEEGIKRELLEKMFKELTILGFVAFSATMLIQAEWLPLTHGQHLCFEFAHVLMFTTAIVYAKEIYLVAGSLHGIMEKFDTFDEVDTGDILVKQVELYGNRTDAVPLTLYQPVSFKLRMSRHLEHIKTIFSRHEQVVTFKALKFHFLGFNGLLGTRFSVSDYIERCSEKHVGEMIEIGLEAWGTLLAVLFVGLGGSWFETEFVDDVAVRVHVGTALFVVWGFFLLLGEIGLLVVCKDNLSRMTEKNHHIRTEMDGDRWEEYDEHQAILESEMRALDLALEDHKEATKINEEMMRAYAMYEIEVEAMNEMNKSRLDKLEAAFQTFMLLQSMLQGLILMMLMRNCIVLYGMEWGVVMIVLMWLPTEVMTRIVTPHVLAQLALAYAIGVRNKEVLDEMMEDATAEGDYAAAGQVLELALTHTLTEEEIGDENTVREKVKDLLKLGEMKWRYRVVEEGQNPRDEAIKVLDQAQNYVTEHIYQRIVQDGKEAQDKGALVAKHEEENWAEELSECCQVQHSHAHLASARHTHPQLPRPHPRVLCPGSCASAPHLQREQPGRRQGDRQVPSAGTEAARVAEKLFQDGRHAQLARLSGAEAEGIRQGRKVVRQVARHARGHQCGHHQGGAGEAAVPRPVVHVPRQPVPRDGGV